MAPELAAALAAYAIAVDGNIVEGVWSIGGPLPADPIVSGLLGDGQGISFSHNNYEGDGSIARNDAYTNNGDAHSLNLDKFENVYAVGGNDTSEDGFAQRYTLDKFRQRFQQVQDDAIANNSYYFTGAFSTIVVVPAAYNFVINFMSNHTADEPSGYLVRWSVPRIRKGLANNVAGWVQFQIILWHQWCARLLRLEQGSRAYPRQLVSPADHKSIHR